MLFFIIMIPVLTFYSLIILLINTSFYLATTLQLLKIRKIQGMTKVRGIIGYTSSLYLIHLSSFLCISLTGEIPNLIRPEHFMDLLLNISRLSLFVTVPLFIHNLFPTSWCRIIEWMMTILAICLAVISFSELFPPLSFTIGIYTLLIVLGGYAMIYGIIATLHIPRIKIIGSRELGYSFVALGAFLVFIPFMIPSDLTFIPQGFLEDKFYFFPYHALAVNIGFFFISVKHKGHWIDGILTPQQQQKSLKAIDPAEVIMEYSLSKRESEIYLLLIKNYSYKEIANTLSISTATAKTHIINLYRKIGINKKTQLPGITHKNPVNK